MTDDQQRISSRAPSDRLVASQRTYYDLRAPDYGLESRPSDRPIRGLIADPLVAAVVDDIGLGDDVIEFACGPGLFTSQLARRARSVTAIDASPRMLERNRREVGAPNVRYLEADLFSWVPDREYDWVFFGFWLSHVPPDRFEGFWGLVRGCLGPMGRVGFVDEDDRASGYDETMTLDEVPASRRRLADGTTLDIVKVFWKPDELEQQLGGLGWDVAVHPVGGSFLYGVGEPRAYADPAT